MAVTVKQYLKDAKRALVSEDCMAAIEACNSVLNLENDNYFAHVLLGKAYSMQNSLKFSKHHYEQAINKDPGSLLAWKGMFALFKGAVNIQEFSTYDEYFEFCAQYAGMLLAHQESQVELVNSIKAFVKAHKDCRLSYLQNLRPGMPLADELGRHLMNSKDALKELLNAIAENENKEVSKLVSRERLKSNTSDPAYISKINSIAWQIYSKSELNSLYEQLINVTDDDAARRKLEDQWLIYRIKILKSMPKDLKPLFYEDVKKMVDDMVVVEHDSILAWKLHFEWQDSESLNDLDMDLIAKFLKKFPSEPLALILSAWVYSNFSEYDSDKFYLLTSDGKVEQTQANQLTDLDESENLMLEQFGDAIFNQTRPKISEAEIVESLTTNIKNTQQSVLSHRIFCHYFIVLQEYAFVVPYIKSGITLVSHNLRDLGTVLPNCKRDFILCYATAYTYFDAPKHHSTALSLFDKLLEDDPGNSKAKLGKGLIYIERSQWQGAHDLLSDVVYKYPNNYEALSELGWSQLHLGNPDNAIETFNSVLETFKADDVHGFELLSLTHWRAAKALLYKHENEYTSDEIQVKLAYKHLVQSIHITEAFSPGYSLLGYIYDKYFMDPGRAFKCYFKAFELNTSDLNAAKYMVERHCDMLSWQSAADICKRIVEMGDVKPSKLCSWPYRVLGIFYLEKQQEAEAIQWFQSAVRLDSLDTEAWIGLGQAYSVCGRIAASVNVYEKALELNPKHKFARYLLAASLCQMGEFEKGIELLSVLNEEYPLEEIFLVQLSGFLVDYSTDLHNQGYLIKSIGTALKAVRLIEVVVTKLNKKVSSVFVTLSKVLSLFMLTQSQFEKFPLESLLNILEACELKNTSKIDAIDETSLDGLLHQDPIRNVGIVARFLILVGKYAIGTSDYENLPRTVRSSLWYNLGIAELSTYILLKQQKFRTAAVQCFKESIMYQSNAVYSWIGLGIATMNLNYRVCQHCFIKAIALAPKEVSVWYAFALLALKNNDVFVSKKVAHYLHSFAPQNHLTWFILGLISEKDGNMVDSSRFFANSFVISNGGSKTIQLFYAISCLRKRIGNNDDERDIDAKFELSAVAYALDQYLKKSSDDSLGLQCAILTSERLHNFGAVSVLSNRLSDMLEKRYEETKDEAELFNFALLKSQLARSQLAVSNYDSAIECANLALGLLEDKDSPSAIKAILSNHVVLGISHCFKGAFDDALGHFQELLSAFGDSHELVLLVSRMLYGFGQPEIIDIALRELHEYTATHGSNILIILTIAALTLFENKMPELSSILTKLESLPLNSLIYDRYKDIPLLIEEINKKLGNNRTANLIRQRSVYFTPNNLEVWKGLNNKINYRIAALGQNSVTAEYMSSACVNLGNLSKIQFGLFLCPWNKVGVISLSSCF
ncbi:SKI complex subunit tetratricopeptide repeat protein SKI3 Ecym_2820 [Eremothecium cymbalariae DBVPG|uniref:Superkiller protein 3 n=1 Tax=Eremothecium cymbalariae (strain CBS 270.75 / DBVPG 7215 / KCTC 17166 / NRRL Y-17582) TaxID=931890 RepID=G8JQF3_ERECY|nr:Hypothetical protein Ecym_2820 [Eremothecium cymbalariae DBVPG\